MKVRVEVHVLHDQSQYSWDRNYPIGSADVTVPVTTAKNAEHIVALLTPNLLSLALANYAADEVAIELKEAEAKLVNKAEEESDVA